MSPARGGPVGLDQTMRMSVASVALCGAALAMGALALTGGRPALGVLIGAALATANLYVFARIGQAFLGQRGRAAPWAAIAVLKLVFLFGGIWMILKAELVSGLALAVGYAALPVGITLGTLLTPRGPDDDGTLSAQPRQDVVDAGRRPPEADPPARDPADEH